MNLYIAKTSSRFALNHSVPAPDNFATARLQRRLNRALEGAALVRLDLDDKDRPVRRAGRDLRSYPLHRVRFRETKL